MDFFHISQTIQFKKIVLYEHSNFMCIYLRTLEVGVGFFLVFVWYVTLISVKLSFKWRMLPLAGLTVAIVIYILPVFSSTVGSVSYMYQACWHNCFKGVVK